MNVARMQILQAKISGDVFWDKETLKFYSVDASSYQITPNAVVVPKDIQDVVNTVKLAKKFHESVTVRGAGTSLAGNSLNSGIILDMKNLHAIKVRKNFAVVGPGTSKGRLDKELEKHNKFFPPNPSIGRYCSIGGMLGNNSSGSKSLKYGSTIDNVFEVTFVDGNGKLITLPKNLVLGRKILALSEKIELGRIPQTTKNSSGYRIEGIRSIKNAQNAIIGAEGTLGIIVSAKIRIREIPKKRILHIIEYDSTRKAAEDCLRILYTKPAALEFVDAQTLKHFKSCFNKNIRCLLFAEYDSELAKAGRQIKNAVTGSIRKVISEREIQQWWRIRDMSLHYSLKSIKPEERIPHVIEDATVPVRHLAKLFEVVEEINERFHTSAITYGHAGNGNIHVRLLASRQNPEKIRQIAKYYFKRIIKLGGSISGEHGDGLARSEFVRCQYGAKNYQIFRQLKELLDPDNILNPGKIVSGSRMTKNLP